MITLNLGMDLLRAVHRCLLSLGPTMESGCITEESKSVKSLRSESVMPSPSSYAVRLKDLPSSPRPTLEDTLASKRPRISLLITESARKRS